MRMFGIFVVWLIVFAVGSAGAWAYKEYIVKNRPTMQSRIDEYEKKWAEALKDVDRNPPPDFEPIVKDAPFGQQHELRQKLDEINKNHSGTYKGLVEKRYDELVREFERSFHVALATLADTPSVDGFLKKHVDEYHVKDLRPKLVSLSESLEKRNPRTDLRIDAFSGYFVLRSEKFRTRLKQLLDQQKLSMKLHLADDNAEYEKRLKAVESGAAPLAVFTLDALINNSEACPTPPAAAFLLIDETRGADAVVAFPDVFASPEDLAKQPDLRIVLTRDSPSEILGRLVCDKYKVPVDCFIKKEKIDDVYEAFTKASPGDHSVFVLWEPFVSKAIADKSRKVHRLITSEKFPGSIVDVLVVQKKYLKDHPAEVKAIAQAYLEASAAYRGSLEQTVAAVLEDSKKTSAPGKELNQDEALSVVRGIAWKTTADNYAHFGLNANPTTPLPAVEEMVANIGKVLRDTGAISKQVQADTFYDRETMKALYDAKFSTDSTDDPWTKLQPVVLGSLSKDPIHFTRGSTKISEAAEERLQEVADLMKKQLRYSMEVRGAAKGNKEADKKTALDRAEEVRKWLVEKGGIDAKRLKAVAIENATDEQVGVTFFLLEPPK
jgi:outer membrane protein OmpA-like peptidoglycan-associated protein